MGELRLTKKNARQACKAKTGRQRDRLMLQPNEDTGKAKRDQIKWLSRHIDSSPSLTTPACRTLLLEAHAWRDGDERKFAIEKHRVLAIESRHREQYHKRYLGDTPTIRECRTAKEMLDAGFTLCWSATVHGVVIASSEADHELLSTLDTHWMAINCIYRVVAADWPPAEDDQRLLTIVEELKRRATEIALAGGAAK